MNPLRIRAKNYRTFENLDLDLPTGCVAIIGDNGAGKSSIVNAIDLALFGPPARSFEPYLTEGADAGDLELELVFEHHGVTYLVRRGFSARGRGKTTLDLEVMRAAEPEEGADYALRAPAVFETLTRENAKATQAAIEELLGLTRDTFRASAMLVQGQGGSFMESDPADRKRILADILGLGVWAAMVDLVRRDRRDAETKLERIAGLMGHADEELARVDDLERTLKVCTDIEAAAVKDLATAEAALEQARAEFQALNEQTTLRAQAIAKVENARVAFEALEHRRQTGIEARGHLAVTEAEITKLAAPAVAPLEQEEQALRNRITERELERERYLVRLNEARTAQARRADFLGTASDLNEKAYALREQAEQILAARGGDHAQTCDRCQQVLGFEAATAAAASMHADADRLDAEAAKLDEQAKAIEIPEVGEQPQPDEEAAGALTAILAKLNVARAAHAQRATLDERAAGLRRTIAAAGDPAFLAQHDQAKRNQTDAILAVPPEADPAAIARVQTAGLQAKAWVEQERERLESARRERAVADAELPRLRELEAKLKAARTERLELQHAVDLFEILERAYGRDGIPALIVSNTALPAIELEATRILQELGTSYRVELRTEREKKTGGLADTLDVVLITEAGERPYETLSGGERTRLNLALRIALARLLAHRRGAESRLLAIDEPEFLDAAGTAALATVLQGLSADFDRIILVSHVPDLAGAFDQVLTVTKDGDRSSVAA